VERALAGQRTAVNLGGVDRQAVARGEVLVHPGTLHPSAMIDAEVQLLPSAGRPLPRRSRALFHLGTRQQEASCVLLEGERLEPGRSALAQLHFESPVVALPGDRFILRGFRKQENYGTTVGGGRVIRVLSQRVRPRDLHAVDLLRRMAVADAVNRVALEVLGAGPRGLSLSDLRRRLPLVPGDLDRALDRLRDQSLLVRYDKERGAVVHREHFQDLLGRCLALVDRFHREQPLEPGLRREELRSRLGVDLDPRLFFALLQSLEKNGELAVEHEICRRPGHTARAASPSLEDLVSRVRQIYEDAGLGPPWDASLAAELHADPSHVAGALRLLVDAGDLVRVAGLYFARGALEDLKQRLIAFLDREGQISAAQFKDLVRQSRKFSIPLAEHFDAQKVTLRVGDLRKRRG
jgi:selenocysteine-specific elongation factor